MDPFELVTSYTVQTQRSIMGRVFRRCDRRNTTQTKREFFSMIPGLRTNRTVQYMNQKELLLVWAALAPLMNAIPDSWEIMLSNDAARLPGLREQLDGLLVKQIESAKRDGVPLAATVPPPSAGPRKVFTPHTSSQAVAPEPLEAVQPRKSSGRRAAAKATEALAKVMAGGELTDTDSDDVCVDDSDEEYAVEAPTYSTSTAPVAAAYPAASRSQAYSMHMVPAGTSVFPPTGYAAPAVPAAAPFLSAAPPAPLLAPLLAPTFSEDLDGLDFDMSSPLPTAADLMGAFASPVPPCVPLATWAAHGPAAGKSDLSVDSLYMAAPVIGVPSSRRPVVGGGGG